MSDETRVLEEKEVEADNIEKGEELLLLLLLVLLLLFVLLICVYDPRRSVLSGYTDPA